MKDEFEDLFGESGSKDYTTQCQKHKLRFFGNKYETRMWECPKCPKKKIHLDPAIKFWLGGRGNSDLYPAERKPLFAFREAGEFKGIKIYYSIEYDIDKNWYEVNYRADVKGERYTVNRVERNKKNLKGIKNLLHSMIIAHIFLQLGDEE